MTIKAQHPQIIRGPDVDGCTDFCHHEKTIGMVGIYWVDQDGVEWGNAVAMSLVDGKLGDAQMYHASKSLWYEYDKWVAGEIQTNTASPIRRALDKAIGWWKS